jgi:glutamate N-acetyltransferase / amino-acid N-acetyltransferase
VTAEGPRGFRVWTGNIGVKASGAGGAVDDAAVIISEAPAVASAVFTRSRFAGPSVTLSRAAIADGSVRGVVVVSGNANVATGAVGVADAEEVRRMVAEAAGIAADDLLIASTGVIGRRYPMDAVRVVLGGMDWPAPDAGFDRAARAIMTTDTRPKRVTVRCGAAALTGIAKGVGMIEPNMATLLTFFCTDAQMDRASLDSVFRRVVDRTFNAISIDTDTSTSDTAAVFANGLAGPVDPEEFERCLDEVALRLVKMIAADGEGASKVIVVRVTGAGSSERARRVGKTIVNSPLVRTAVHGADPNWGRVAMAVGKCEQDVEIVPERVVIRFGSLELYPAPPSAEILAAAAAHLAQDEVLIEVDLGIGAGEFTVFGCDLTEGYVKLNANYTT